MGQFSRYSDRQIACSLMARKSRIIVSVAIAIDAELVFVLSVQIWLFGCLLAIVLARLSFHSPKAVSKRYEVETNAVIHV